jgi:hypothetical protein
MPSSKETLSVFLSISLMITVAGVDGCSKKREQAQSQGGQPQTAQQQQAPATTYATPTPDQLYQLVAPIALFPDNLVAQVLAASTFPDQISAAYQWLQRNAALKGQQLMEAINQQPWDASVKGVTQFSDVLQQMATNLSWTSALGDAYYNIPQSVMNAIQVMRQRAYQAGNLKTNQQQSVSVENQQAGSESSPASSQPQTTVVQAPPQTIVIQPAQPEVVYVPTYNPTAVYGTPVPAYPGYTTGEMVATSLLSFGLGIAVGAAISGGGGCCGWGWNSWGCGWHNSTVVYNRNVYVSNSSTFANRNNYYNRNFNNANYDNINRNNINANNNNRNNFNANNVNRNNLHANNINRNNLHANNINHNNLNANNINHNNLNNRTNNFNSNYTTPHFNQKYDQQQFRNQNQGNLAQQRGGAQPNFNQQNRAGYNPQQNRPGSNQQANRSADNRNQARPNSNQNQRQPERGYGEQPNRGAGNSAFGNYGEGGNARINSARGQQSLEGGRGSGGGNRAGGGGFRGRR